MSQVVYSLAATTTHATLPDACRKLGLPDPPSEGSKKEKATASFEAVADADLPRVAENYLKAFSVRSEDRNRIQDLVWADGEFAEIPKRIRRELARTLKEPLFADGAELMKLLDGLWILDDDPSAIFFSTPGGALRQRIEQHVLRNPEDWDAEMLFQELGALTASDRRFALFLEGLSSAEVLTDEAAQRAFVNTVNQTLRFCGVELRETGSSGGYPVFCIVPSSAGVARKPKNLIFATAEKPDIRLRSAVDNDVEIVSNVDAVLIYERSISGAGLTWSHLQTWWSETRNIADPVEAKKSLYRRLLECLPATSPPQRWFFDGYHGCFKRDIPNLPALLPEVWLHWDPKTVAARGAEALLRFRMDYLMLLPGGVRVVMEIDGKQHYADSTGRADTGRYATMASADRELKLAGYEVFHFGAAELCDETSARVVVSDFFQELFDRYKIAYSNPAAR